MSCWVMSNYKICKSERISYFVWSQMLYDHLNMILGKLRAEFTYPNYCVVLILRRTTKISNKTQLLGRKE